MGSLPASYVGLYAAKLLPSSRSRGTTARQANDEGRRKPECSNHERASAHFFRHSGFARRAVATQRRVIPSSFVSSLPAVAGHSSLLHDLPQHSQQAGSLFSMTAGTAVFRHCGESAGVKLFSAGPIAGRRSARPRPWPSSPRLAVRAPEGQWKQRRRRRARYSHRGFQP